MKKRFLLPVFIVLFVVSCKDEPTLQEYYVENQNNSEYLAFDIPASLLTGGNSMLDAEQRATLETIRKVNVLGLPLKEGNKEIYEAEKEKLTEILKSDKYQLLMKYGGGNRKAELYYLGDDDAIDELIAFGSDDEKGFGVARVTGNKMNPEALIKLFKSLEKGEINIDALPNLTGFMD